MERHPKQVRRGWRGWGVKKLRVAQDRMGVELDCPGENCINKMRNRTVHSYLFFLFLACIAVIWLCYGRTMLMFSAQPNTKFERRPWGLWFKHEMIVCYLCTLAMFGALQNKRHMRWIADFWRGHCARSTGFWRRSTRGLSPRGRAGKSPQKLLHPKLSRTLTVLS